MKFYLNEEFITDETVIKKGNTILDKGSVSNQDLISLIKGEGYWSTVSHQDHPEFTKLRDQLEQEGYIRTERNFWNGDSVIKPFYFNDVKFKAGDTFYCAVAMKGHIKLKKKSNGNNS